MPSPVVAAGRPAGTENHEVGIQLEAVEFLRGQAAVAAGGRTAERQVGIERRPVVGDAVGRKVQDRRVGHRARHRLLVGLRAFEHGARTRGPVRDCSDLGACAGKRRQGRLSLARRRKPRVGDKEEPPRSASGARVAVKSRRPRPARRSASSPQPGSAVRPEECGERQPHRGPPGMTVSRRPGLGTATEPARSTAVERPPGVPARLGGIPRAVGPARRACGGHRPKEPRPARATRAG